MSSPQTDAATITAMIGDVRDSQIAIGNNILQVNAQAGAIVTVVAPRRRPRPKPRPTPVLVRPRPFAGFLDRQGEAGMALATLGTGGTVEVLGDGGIGRTSLLRHLCFAPHADAFPDGIIYLAAAGRPAEDILHLVFGHFYRTPGRYKPTEPELCDAFLDKRALIVLDDVDLLRDDLHAVADALPGCAILFATESRRLWGDSQTIPLHGLPVDDAVVLVERELGRVLLPDERETAKSLCAALNGHPLHLLQAAAQLRQSGGLLTATVPAPDVDAQQRAVLLLLACAGELDMGALAGLTGNAAVEQVVQELIELRLIETQDDTFRIAAGEETKLDEAELDPERRRVIAWLVTWAEARQHDIAAIGARAPLLLRMLREALAAGDSAAALRLGRAIEGPFMLLGLWGAWRIVLEACARAGSSLADTGAVEAWVLHQLGTLDCVRGDVVSGATQLEAALRIREALDDEAGAAATRNNLHLLRTPPTPLQRLREWTGPAAGRKAAVVMGAAVVGGAALFWQFTIREPVVELSATPDIIDFAGQTVGASGDPREIRITNASRGLVRLDDAVIDGDDFVITADGCTGILRGETSCTITTAFIPSASGYRTARLRLHGERVREQSRITLAGYGIDALAADTTPPPPPPPPDTVVTRVPEVTAHAVDFGEREVGTLVVGTGVLSNTGTVPLSFGRLALSGDADFRLFADGCSGRSLSPGSQCEVEVEFAPTEPGPRTGTIAARAADGSLLTVLHVHGGGGEPPPPPPPPPPAATARIERFTASPARIQAGAEARLCYVIADAVAAAIRPAPDRGSVVPEPQHCVTVRPPRTRTYTLQVTGPDRTVVERQVTVTVTQPERPPPPTPDRLVPGSTQTANPEMLTTCPQVVARWGAVSVPGAQAAYEVVLEQGVTTTLLGVRREVWRELHRARPTTTSADFGRPLGDAMQRAGEGAHKFRWTVRAIDPAGTTGAYAPHRFFSCAILH